MIQFNIIDLYRRNAQAWQQRIHSTRLYPLLHAELLNQLVKAGFEAVTAYGDMEGVLSTPAKAVILCSPRVSGPAEADWVSRET